MGAAAASVRVAEGAEATGPRGGLATGATFCSLYGPPCWGLIRPPPGGEPYFATISGGAIRVDLPKTTRLNVTGSLSSSTQTYSGSLATSPKRGFLMSSHLGSLARIATLGSFWGA